MAHDHHDHGHGHPRGLRGLFRPHRHTALFPIDSNLEASRLGKRALWLSLLGLAATAAAQLVVALLSGSVALLNDTFHNGADALTVLPLWLAFTVGRRAATSRFTYGFGRAEDLAGVAIVLFIAASGLFAAFESVRRLMDPAEVSYLPAVMAAAVIGFAGNEAVARLRINTGTRIGSAALIADGLHARTDGLGSLGVLAGAVGVALGVERADAVAGLVIAVVILKVFWEAATGVGLRLMDGVEPGLAERVSGILAAVPGALGVGELRLRWIGHRLHCEAEVRVDDRLSVVEGHRIAEDARHALLHQVPMLAKVIIHADPASADGVDHHAEVRHHDGPPA
ncbi:MAG TPA: cation diffusion facilitator family transporter [Acidimicrobiales bacterium]|nr:cation diffusion facilitator family transporter [Acidimicrobiales bacterium]